jgi:hypothetical protein
MRIRSAAIAVVTIVIGIGAVTGLVKTKLSAQNSDGPPTRTAAKVAEPLTGWRSDSDLAEHLKAISSRAGGTVGVAVIHVEGERPDSLR